MADDANEDSWLYGTSNPDSTTNEEEKAVADGVVPAIKIKEEFENEAAAAPGSPNDFADAEQSDTAGEMPPQGDNLDGYGEFEEDPAREMEEDEEATAAAAADTTDAMGGNDSDAADREQYKPSGGSAGSEEDDEDESDDDINVVIGDIKSGPSTYNIKQRSNLLAGSSAAGQEKQKSTQGGKFSIEEFESVGTINGVPAHEFSIDSLEEKPWRKPGADITDYFNYGFNEETWRAYCERQKRFRVVESGVGLASLTANLNQSGDRHHHDGGQGGVVPVGMIGSGGTPMGGIGSMDMHQMPPPVMMQNHHQRPLMGPRGPRLSGGPPGPNAKENVIQVMTAECREYSRPGVMPPNFGPPVPMEEPYFPEAEQYDYGYEPTQESQWMNENPNWVPTGIKELTPGPNMPPPTNNVTSMPPPGMAGPPGVPPPQIGGPPGVPPPHVSGPAMRGPPMMGGMPPNLAMGPPPGMGMMMGPGGPPMRMPMGPPRNMGPPPHSPHIDRERHDRGERDRDRDRDRDRERDRDRDRDRERREERDRERDRDRDRDRDREYERRERDRDRERGRERERDVDREMEKVEKGEEVERTDEDRERRRRERERDRERSRRDRSRSREKTRRRSKSREKEREKDRDKEGEKDREKERDKERDKERHKDRESRSSKSSRSEKKKHRKDKEEEE